MENENSAKTVSLGVFRHALERRFFVSYLPIPYFETQLSFFNNPGNRAVKGIFIG
jgi:hypothetical protein